MALLTEGEPVIQDVMDFNYELTEDVDDQAHIKCYNLKGVFQQADTRNGNGRFYPRIVLDREVSRMQPMIKENRVLGELDHPADAKIHLDKVSHLVTRLEMRPTGEVYGEAKVLETPSGKVLQELLKSDIKLGVSSRGFGSVKRSNDMDEVQGDYKMVTFDIVSDPSTPTAFPNAVFEGKEEEEQEEHKVPMSLVIEDIFDTDPKDHITDKTQGMEYIGVVDKTRFYLAEGGYESYGTFRNHASHYWHIEAKSPEGTVKIAITEAKLVNLKNNFGEDIIKKALQKLGYKGYHPENLTKQKTTFASKEIEQWEV